MAIGLVLGTDEAGSLGWLFSFAPLTALTVCRFRTEPFAFCGADTDYR